MPLRLRYLIITAAFIVVATWATHAYRGSVVDDHFLLYGQSIIVGRPAIQPPPFPSAPRELRNGITLERTTCFGSCPAYLLQIDASGTVSFRQGPPSNRFEERTATITPDQFQRLAAGFAAIRFSELNAVYSPSATDLPSTHIALTIDGKTKRITHSDIVPPGLEELERTIELAVNVHRWLHGDTNRFSLQSPVAGSSMDRGGEDLKNGSYVRRDVESRIKPGMTELMQIAGGLGAGTKAQARAAMRRMERMTDADVSGWAADELQQALQRRNDVNAADETGWTALMIAAAMAQPQSVSALLAAGATVDQRDSHRDTALIGASSIRFGNFAKVAEVIDLLLKHGASVDAVNDLGESALMWAARAGNPAAIKALLGAGANPARTNRSGHDALFYLRNARDSLTFDPDLVERYKRAESALIQR